MSEQVKVLQPEDVPEVKALLSAELDLQEHIESNKKWYRKLAELVEARNGLAKLADAKVRDLHVSCGPFVKISSTKTINIEKLFEELGEEQFKNFGGYTETVVNYKVDRNRVLSYAESKAIPEEIVKACIEDKESYKKIPIYMLP